ncbi:hypothetical protein [Streptomyces sp. NPDC096142]|uniref:hypothetical protein n=1 Tax=Streptomyces sp. NPDC096142 TaxID=3366077 RepID=UPI003824C678
MQNTPTSVLALLIAFISLDIGLLVGIFAAHAGHKGFYDASTIGGGAGLAVLVAILAFWAVVAALRALRQTQPPAQPTPAANAPGGSSASST